MLYLWEEGRRRESVWRCWSGGLYVLGKEKVNRLFGRVKVDTGEFNYIWRVCGSLLNAIEKNIILLRLPLDKTSSIIPLPPNEA